MQLSKRQEEIAVEREEIDKRKKLLAKRKPQDSNGPAGHRKRNANAAGISGGNGGNSATTSGTASTSQGKLQNKLVKSQQVFSTLNCDSCIFTKNRFANPLFFSSSLFVLVTSSWLFTEYVLDLLG